MIKRFVIESFQALFEELDYIIAFYLFGGTMLGVTGALLQARGLPTNGIVAIIVTLIIPIHFAVFGVYRRCHRQAASDTMVVKDLLDGFDAEGDQKSLVLRCFTWVDMPDRVCLR